MPAIKCDGCGRSLWRSQQSAPQGAVVARVEVSTAIDPRKGTETISLCSACFGEMKGKDPC